MNLAEIFELSALDYILLALLAVMIYRWFIRRNEPEIEAPKPVQVPALPKQDMTLSELKKYDGVQDEHILFGLNGTIYDVSRGRSFYGPGGPYGTLAGHDATRALGTMDAKAVRDEWDDCTDLKPDERESADEWESSFKFKYPTVGKLVKDASDKTVYAEGEMRSLSLSFVIFLISIDHVLFALTTTTCKTGNGSKNGSGLLARLSAKGVKPLDTKAASAPLAQPQGPIKLADGSSVVKLGGARRGIFIFGKAAPKASPSSLPETPSDPATVATTIAPSLTDHP